MPNLSPIVVMKNEKHMYVGLCLLSLICFFLSSFMAEICIASLNVNGAREGKKRFRLFETIRQKKVNVLFAQESHSDEINESDWAREFDGLSILSHLSSTSGGVAILFSKSFVPCSYQVEEILKGRLLKVRAQFENSFFVFISVYVPTRAIERMCFLDTLSHVLANCNTEDVLILGGDFNCMENLTDRNHVEPHMPSRKRLIELMKSNEIADVWKNFHFGQRQYTWTHVQDNLISLARLDRFYGYKHQLNFFRGCSIIPVGFSDLGSIKPKSAYWHLNNNLLCDLFLEVFLKIFGLILDQKSLPFNLYSSGGILRKYK